jgi:hypothetical protein
MVGRAAPAEAVEIAVGESGLTSLIQGGVEFLERSVCAFEEVRFSDDSAADLSYETNVDPARGIVWAVYPWGRLVCAYAADGNRLDLRFWIENRSGRTIEQVKLAPLDLRLPDAPQEYDGETPLLGHNKGEPTIVPLTWSRGRLVFVNEDPARPLVAGFPWALDRPVNTVFVLRLNTGREEMYPNWMPAAPRPIPDGATEQLHLSLRFAAPDVPTDVIAADAYMRFAEVFPFRSKWLDRRPIGAIFLGASEGRSRGNPRGWFMERERDTVTATGVSVFQRRVLKLAEESLARLKAMGAQGMIVWDLEGDQFDHPITYIGDASQIDAVAPEFAPVVDEFFRIFRDGGMRVGLLIRPQRFVLGEDGQGRQEEVTDPAEIERVLDEKISFAQAAWGATLFHIDSKGDPNDPIDASIVERLMAAHPDILLVPEHETTRYFASTAPWLLLRPPQRLAGTPQHVRRVYPEAFSVIDTSDGDLDRRRDELVEAVRRGDILMFRAYFDDRANDTVKSILDEAHRLGRLR